jgi:hypothetical protein
MTTAEPDPRVHAAIIDQILAAAGDLISPEARARIDAPTRQTPTVRCPVCTATCSLRNGKVGRHTRYGSAQAGWRTLNRTPWCIGTGKQYPPKTAE